MKCLKHEEKQYKTKTVWGMSNSEILCNVLYVF